jgi:hypothetical protein
MGPNGKYYFPVASEDIYAFQQENKINPTGRVDSATKKALLAAGYVEQDIPSNLKAIVNELKKFDPQQGKGGYSAFSDPEYLRAVVGNAIKESQGKYVNEDLLNWKFTNNDRMREYFGYRIPLAFGPKKWSDYIKDMISKGKTKEIGKINYTPEELAEQNAKLDAFKSQDIKSFMEQWSEVIYGHDTPVGKSMGNTEKGDGWKYRGRGFIGITGKYNYRARSQEIFGDDRLVNDPELINDPKYGAMAAALFLRKGEANMRRALGIPNGPLSAENARHLVTSQIAGSNIKNKAIANEILGKVKLGGEQYASVAGVSNQARTGGIFRGPSTGYNVTLHGEEMVVPGQEGVSKQALGSMGGSNKKLQERLIPLLESFITKQNIAIDLLDNSNSNGKKLVNAMT